MKLNKTIRLFTTILMVISLIGCNQFVASKEPIPDEEEPIIEEPVVEKPVEEEPIVEEPIEEESESEQEPEEFNPYNFKQVYGLKFDVPVYTDEEREIAKENLLNNYKGFEKTKEIPQEERMALAKDFYIANQETIYLINDRFSEFEYEKIINDIGIGLYYDETNDTYIRVLSEKEMIHVYCYNPSYFFIFGKNPNITDEDYSSVDYIGEPDSMGFFVCVSPNSSIDIDGKRAEKYYEEWADTYARNKDDEDFVRDFNELFEYGYKQNEIEKPLIHINEAE